MTDQCNRCRYWLEDMEDRDPNDPNFGFGRCRLAPPVIVPTIAAMLMPRPVYGDQTDPDMPTTSLYSASKHAVTFATDWCGSFKSIPANPSPVAEAFARWVALHVEMDGVDIDSPECDEKCKPIFNAIDAQAAIIRTSAPISTADLAAKLRVALSDIGSSSWDDERIITGTMPGDDLADGDPGEKLIFQVVRHLEAAL